VIVATSPAHTVVELEVIPDKVGLPFTVIVTGDV
jgi:hypothetical protein